MNKKLIKNITGSILGIGILSATITGFVLANKVSYIKTSNPNSKNNPIKGFEDKLSNIDEEQIKLKSQIEKSYFKKASEMRELTNEIVSKWKIAGSSAKFQLKENTWRIDDNKGSISYSIIASREEESKEFNIIYPPGSFLTLIRKQLVNWLEIDVNGNKSKYNSSKINLKYLLFKNTLPDSKLKPSQVIETTNEKLTGNFDEINSFPTTLNKRNVQLEIFEWNKGSYIYKDKKYGNINIKIKLTYTAGTKPNSWDEIIFQTFEVRNLKEETAKAK